MSPQLMAKWRAFRQVQPHWSDRLAAILVRGFQAVFAVHGGTMDDLDDDYWDPLGPERTDEEKRADNNEASPNAAALLASMALGKPHGNRNR